jgi:Arc/MetJ-type ribon-helix-helix transcriptional regulator
MTESISAQADTITISAKVSHSFDYRVRLAVVERRLSSKSDAIRQALEQWLDMPPSDNGEQSASSSTNDGKDSS